MFNTYIYVCNVFSMFEQKHRKQVKRKNKKQTTNITE